jgi:hypothetical protein
MRMHSRTHWIAVALVLAALLLALNEAHGRSAGAGPPPADATQDAAPDAARPRMDAAIARKEVAKPKDTGLAREERSAVQKGKRAAKRTAQRSRTGVGVIDSEARTGG